MADSSTQEPPPYTTDTPPLLQLAGTATPLASNPGLAGLHSLIMDNAPILWALGHGGRKLPHSFQLLTAKAAAGMPVELTLGLVYAGLTFLDEDQHKRLQVRLFVRGPQRDTTEAALWALLEKMQHMIGNRMYEVFQYTTAFGGRHVYLKS